MLNVSICAFYKSELQKTFACTHPVDMSLSLVAACEGQVSQLHVLQVHLYLWRDERPEHGRGLVTLHLVLRAMYAASPHATLQGSLRIRTWQQLIDPCDRFHSNQATKCKWRGHTCLLLLSVFGGMPASHKGMQARLFVVDI